MRSTERIDVKRAVVLANPAAGAHSAEKAADAASARLRARGVDVTMLTGNSAADSAELVERAVADRVDVVVAVGGDGMINLALQLLVDTEVALGIVPAGTGNDHARAHDIPRDPIRAADVISDGNFRRVDVGRVVAGDGGSRYFGTIAMAGFDSLVTERTNRMRWPRGPMRYNIAAVVEFAKLRPLPFTIHFDDTTVKQNVTLVAIGNTNTYGGGMQICPQADPFDGTFDITVIRAVSHVRLVRMFPGWYRGTHVRHPDVQTYKSTTVRIEGFDVQAFADGEPVGPLPVSVTSHPAALCLLVGQGA